MEYLEAKRLGKWIDNLQGPACVRFYRRQIGRGACASGASNDTCLQSLPQERVPPDPYRLSACIVKIGNWPECAVDSGKPPATSVVAFVPGVGASHTMWLSLVELLSERCNGNRTSVGRTLVCLIDNRGTGGSELYPPPAPICRCVRARERKANLSLWTAQALADDARYVLEQVLGATKALDSTHANTSIRLFLVGHSLGSAILCHLLLTSPPLEVSGIMFLSMHQGRFRDWFPPSARAVRASVRYWLWWIRAATISTTALQNERKRLRLLTQRAAIDLSLHFSDAFLASPLEPAAQRSLLHAPRTDPSAGELHHIRRSAETATATASALPKTRYSRPIRRHEWYLFNYTAESLERFRAWDEIADVRHSSGRNADPLNAYGSLGQLHAVQVYRLTRADLERLRVRIPEKAMLLYGRDDPLTRPRACRAFAEALGIPAIELTGAHLITEESKIPLAQFLLDLVRA